MSRYISRISLIICLLGLAVDSFAQSADPSPISSGPVSRASSAFSLKAEASLQKPVMIEATDLPLGELLKDLSRKAHVFLVTTPKIEDQRVTLRIPMQPLHQVMTRLCGLLSHSPAAPRGYFWSKESGADALHPHYRLARDLRSIAEEQEALNFPHRKAAALLRDMRNLSRMSAAERKRYKGDLTADYLEDPEMQPFRDALTGASDGQIDALVQSGSMPLDSARFADKIARFNKTWHDLAVQQQQRVLKSGGKDPYPNGVPDAPSDTPAVTFTVDDYNGEHPERAAIFGLRLDGVQTLEAQPGFSGSSHVTFSPLRKSRPPFPDTVTPGDPIFDLTPLLTGPEVTPEQQGDVGFTLQMLAKVADISLYQEEFYKTVSWGSRSKGLKVLKGTVSQLLDAICMEWEYNAEKVGADYVLWSANWAQDRVNDVPERLIVRWKERFQKQNGFTLNDRIEIASTLTWPQLRLTLQMRLPEAGPWNMRREAEELQFIGAFSASEREAMAGQGLPVAAMSLQQQNALLSEIRSRAGALSPDDAVRSRLFLEPDPNFQTEGKRSSRLEVRSEAGKSLWWTAVGYQTVLK